MFEKVDYVMVSVFDMKRSIAFYRDLLGVPLKFESPDWTEFQTGPTTLALHGGATQGPREQSRLDTIPAGTCTIGFNVQNLQHTYDDLKAKGVPFVMPPTDRGDEGIKLAVALDPDGLAISFAEMLQKK